MIATSVHAQVLGPSFACLPPLLRGVHDARSRKEFSGRCSIVSGRSWLARAIQLFASLPRQSHEDAAVHVVIERSDGGEISESREIWKRNFGGQRMQSVIRRGRVLFADLDGLIEIRNQARVHLWYPQRFGAPYPRLGSAEDGIDRFLVRCTCVGLAPQGDGSLRLYAPYGLDELEQGIIRPNANAPSLHRFRKKAETYRERWPFLRIEDN